MFVTNPVSLQQLLNDAHEGQLQLPDFQRSYVWSAEDVRNLIASVAKGYPIGAFLSLATGGDVNFKPRPLEGVDRNKAGLSAPRELLLDGQQRLTSLYQSIYSNKPVRTLNSRGQEVDRYYCIDIMAAISSGADVKEAIVGVPADRILRTNFGRDIEKDLSCSENEFKSHAFPLNEAFPFPEDWFFRWQDYWRERGKDVFESRRDFVLTVIKRIQGYQIPVIRLDRDNGREAICLIFEKVNMGGKPLNTFELLTAMYAADRFDLRSDWMGPLDKSEPGRRERMIGTPNRIDVLSGVTSTDFLQACALLDTREERLAKEATGVEGRALPQVSCNREALLQLPLEAYKKHADYVEYGFREAASFLHGQKVISRRDVPYAPMVVGLASTFAILGREARTAPAKDKLARWLWAGTLGEIYGSATESLLARDVPALVEWIDNSGSLPRTVDDAIFQQDRLLSLRGRYSAAYKGIHVLLMGYEHGCKDFVTKKPTDAMTFFHDRIDIHHIFPRAWCKGKGIPESDFNSIVNKTPLSAESNRFIGGDAPSVYLKRIEARTGLSSDELDDILRTHAIEPEYLRSDDFKGFFSARIEALAGIVSDVMGKPVVKEHGTNEEERDVDEPDEDDEDSETVDLIDLIRGGESEVVEFKSTLRVNLYTGKTDKEIEHEVLETLAGFLNTNGGTLFIGVSDDLTPLGIEVDRFSDEDKMQLHLVNIVNDRIDPRAMILIHTSFQEYEGHRILVATCDRSPSPFYVMKSNAERFYVRTGPATNELTAGSLVDYIGTRFH